MEKLLEMLCKIGEALIIVASINSTLLCFVLANQRQDFSWYLLAMAIVSLLILWIQENHKDKPEMRIPRDDDKS